MRLSQVVKWNKISGSMVSVRGKQVRERAYGSSGCQCAVEMASSSSIKCGKVLETRMVQYVWILVRLQNRSRLLARLN
jgi:hypothetical protein